MIDAHTAEPNGKSIFRFFYFSSYDWLYLEFYSDTSDSSSVSPTKNKIPFKVVKFTGEVRNVLKQMFYTNVFMFNNKSIMFLFIMFF